MPVEGHRLPVLVAAAGEAWEAAALERLERDARLVLHRRSVDLPDLVASAATGLARCALVTEALSGLDADSVGTLRRSGVGVVVVASAGSGGTDRLGRIGVRTVLGSDLDGMATALLEAAEEGAGDGPPGLSAGPGHRSVGTAGVTAGAAPGAPGRGAAADGDDAAVWHQGRIVGVWGPTGAPGRTTVATGLAAELAMRGVPTLLVDADPYGGAVAQHLGVLDEVSGLLAAARRANAGELGPEGLAEVARAVGDLRVLTGLPRPDRWNEVRPAAYEGVLEAAGGLAERVVVDVGFCLEDAVADPFSAAPRRNETTLATLERADDVVAVGSADPVGLARLVRGLVELEELVPGVEVHVVVNRTRSTLGWSDTEVAAMIRDFGRPVSVHHLPEDRASTDKALMSGRSLVELGDSPLRRGLAEVADGLVAPQDARARARRGRARRRPGRRLSGQAPKSR